MLDFFFFFFFERGICPFSPGWFCNMFFYKSNSAHLVSQFMYYDLFYSLSIVLAHVT